MKFAFVRAEKARYAVALLCRAVGVSRAGYYAWCHRPPSGRQAADDALVDRIRRVHEASRHAYGSPRVLRELRAEGMTVGRHRVARLMRKAAIRGRRSLRFCVTTQSQHPLPVAPNVLERRFQREAPNQAWVADITYVPTREGWLYLAIVLDLFSRRVVGWSMSDRIDQALTIRALRMAVERRCPPPGLVHHSDRGCQYAGEDYQRALSELGAVPSMSRKGNCWDNAVAEAFFRTLKVEGGVRVYCSQQEARKALFDFIERFYNKRRRHSFLGYVSPEEFEKKQESNSSRAA